MWSLRERRGPLIRAVQEALAAAMRRRSGTAPAAWRPAAATGAPPPSSDARALARPNATSPSSARSIGTDRPQPSGARRARDRDVRPGSAGAATAGSAVRDRPTAAAPRGTRPPPRRPVVEHPLASTHHRSAGRWMRRRRSTDPRERKDPGDGLCSRGATPSVSSALESLTAVFGMGTGVASPLESPGS